MLPTTRIQGGMVTVDMAHSPEVEATSAFAYASGTWQLQHLVGATRHQPADALPVLLELLEQLQRDGVRYLRLACRPDHPGVAPLFVPAARRLTPDRAAVSLVDYGMIRSESLQLPTSSVPVRRLAAG